MEAMNPQCMIKKAQMSLYPVIGCVNLRCYLLVLFTVKLLCFKIYKYFRGVTLRINRYPFPHQTLTSLNIY